MQLVSYAFKGTIVILKEKVLFAIGDVYCQETCIVPNPLETAAKAKETKQHRLTVNTANAIHICEKLEQTEILIAL
jgi:hypothetical protein